jgi:hypothetical protein
VVDNFVIKYVGQQQIENLLAALRTNYNITCDWDGLLYIGISIKWDYTASTADIAMPGYIKRALFCFQHPTPYLPEHAPYDWTKPIYGKAPQLARINDTSEPLDAKGTQRVQSVISTFLFYCCAIDPTALAALGSIAAEQSTATIKTNKKSPAC